MYKHVKFPSAKNTLPSFILGYYFDVKVCFLKCIISSLSISCLLQPRSGDSMT